MVGLELARKIGHVFHSDELGVITINVTLDDTHLGGEQDLLLLLRQFSPHLSLCFFGHTVVAKTNVWGFDVLASFTFFFPSADTPSNAVQLQIRFVVDSDPKVVCHAALPRRPAMQAILLDEVLVEIVGVSHATI